MFAVHRKHPNPVAFGFGHYDFSSHDQNFFGRDGNIFPGSNGRQRGLQAGRPDNGDQHDISGRQSG